MHRRDFLYLGPLALSLGRCRSGEPPSASLQPIPEPHFPNRVFQLVWRNWELANTPRIAQVLRTSEANVLALGSSMGLPPKHSLSRDQLRRLHITVIRQNWHLLPRHRIIQLLGWDRPQVRVRPQGRRFPGYQAGSQARLRGGALSESLRGGTGACRSYR